MGPKRIDPETPIDCSRLHCRLKAADCRRMQSYGVGKSKAARYTGAVSRYPSCTPGTCPLGELVLKALGGALSEKVGFFPRKKK